MSHLVITTKEHQKLLLIKKWSKVGWGVSIVMALIATYFMGVARGTTKDVDAISELNEKVNETIKLQINTTETMIKVSEDQKSQGDLLVTWGQYLKNRDEALARNQGYKK